MIIYAKGRANHNYHLLYVLTFTRDLEEERLGEAKGLAGGHATRNQK